MKLRIDRKMRTISYGDFCEEACKDQINLVCSLYGEEFEVTDDLIVDAVGKWVNVTWFIDSFNYPFTGILTYPCGTRKWYRDGKLHRKDGPAVEYPTGAEVWYQNGKIHREDGPAFRGDNGTKRWYQDGVLHRVDGPAVERPDGSREWYQYGRLHREDGQRNTRALRGRERNRHHQLYHGQSSGRSDRWLHDRAQGGN